MYKKNKAKMMHFSNENYLKMWHRVALSIIFSFFWIFILAILKATLLRQTTSVILLSISLPFYGAFYRLIFHMLIVRLSPKNKSVDRARH